MDDYTISLLDEWARCWMERPWSVQRRVKSADKPAAYMRRSERWRGAQRIDDE